MVCCSVLDFSMRSRFRFGWPAGGEVCSLGPPWSYTDARVCKELKLVPFGDFKIQFWVLYSGIPGACLASFFFFFFFDTSMSRCGVWRTGRG
jgi:hypothetical protein